MWITPLEKSEKVKPKGEENKGKEIVADQVLGFLLDNRGRDSIKKGLRNDIYDN